MKLSSATFLFLALSLNACSYLGPSDPLQTVRRNDSNKPSAQLASLDFSNLQAAVIKPKCVDCHGRLASEETFLKMAAKINAAVFVKRSMPQSPVTPLDDCQLEILAEYLEHGSQPEKTVGDLESCKSEETAPSPSPTPEQTPEESPSPTPEPSATP